MRIGFIADIHLANHKRHGGAFKSGINERCQQILHVLKLVAAHLDELDVTKLVVLGDFFDTVRPEPQIITAANEILATWSPYFLMGNHEMQSAEPGDHALGPLTMHATVYERPDGVGAGNGVLLMVPYQPGRAVEWLSECVRKLGMQYKDWGSPKVLCTHVGIIGGDTPPWLRDAHDAVPLELLENLAKEFKIDYVLAGNWHNRKRWEITKGHRCSIMQVGALVPTGWDNPGLDGYGTLAILDTDAQELSHIEIPGPRFVKLKSSSEQLGNKLGHKLYVQCVDDAGCQAQVGLARMKEMGAIAGYEIVPDELESETAARTAAFSARSAQTLEEALAIYVKEMPLEQGIARDVVLSRSRKYLGV